jgi:ribosomal protein S18 acetylase RimI-like enzyme
MSSGLVRIPFTEDLLPKVQAFDCGQEPWELEVSNWIKAPRGGGGAVDDLPRNQVWLYATDNGDLVGFGSFGETSQKWPRSKDPPILASIIPMLGIAKEYWGQPPGPRESRYSTRILEDLIVEAVAHQNERPILILFVNVNNQRAIQLYQRFGFVELHKPVTDKNTGFVNKRMVLDLTSP